MRRHLLLAAAILSWTILLATRAASVTTDVDVSALWQNPVDLETRDLLNGAWGVRYAPDPRAIYTFVRRKEAGTNPGVIVRDPAGRIWHVKQASHDFAEGPVEVALSRVLSGVGYHQPPVYFLPSFTMITDSGKSVIEPGGRFRLDLPTLRDVGGWSWKDHPFVGARPFDGLLVILLMFNSWDLKDSNNTLYEVRDGARSEQWYVVRDLGGALGETGHLRPKRNNIDKFERQVFITHVADGLVEFGYRGKQPELIRHRITVTDVAWAARLMSRLSIRQWHDAFTAGGYDSDTSDRFIAKLRANIAEARLQAIGAP